MRRVSTDTVEARGSRLLAAPPPDTQYSTPNLDPTGVPYDILHDLLLLFPYSLRPRAPITTDIGRTSELPLRIATSTLAPLSPSRRRNLDSVLPYVAQHNVGSHMSHSPRKATCTRTSLGSRRRLHLAVPDPSMILRPNKLPGISPSHSSSLPLPQVTPPSSRRLRRPRRLATNRPLWCQLTPDGHYMISARAKFRSHFPWYGECGAGI